jgi:protein TonB
MYNENHSHSYLCKELLMHSTAVSSPHHYPQAPAVSETGLQLPPLQHPHRNPAFHNLTLSGQQPNLVGDGKSRVTVIVAIVLLHVFFLWLLESISFKTLTKKLPNELVVTMLAADKAAGPPKFVPVRPTLQKVAPVIAQPVLPETDSPVTIALPIENQAAPSVAQVPAERPVQMPLAVAVPKTVTSGVEYIRAPKPVYPAVARRMREQGRAVVRVLVDKNGLPQTTEIQQSSGSLQLDEAARQAVLQALFKPLLEDGQPVAVFVLVPIRFQLDR